MAENKNKKLGEISSTAICGNDIMSSVLYVSAVAIGVVGVYAPLILLAIGIVLLLYKGVYREVIEALPVNGGAYNALLNGTSKNIAATAGILTILSYIATCVISGKTAVSYLSTIAPIPIILTTIIVICIFALLVISGVKDSSRVALGIFFIHLFTLLAFVILGIIYIANNNSHLELNFHLSENFFHNKDFLFVLFLGFASSLLGVSGFESSADFVEEQKKGVFKKTLRNMLIGIIIFNPLIAFICLNISPLNEIQANSNFLLAEEAKIIGGQSFQYLVVFDAFLVLCGAVLTSFIGVSGLTNRMALDEALPLWFSKKNRKGAHPRIIITFLLFSISILILTNGELSSLAGVYALSFLAVMSMFALGNIILKITRHDLKRFYTFPIIMVILAFSATFSGFIGNIILDGKSLHFFLSYFIPLFLGITVYIYRTYILALCSKLLKGKTLLSKIIDLIAQNATKGKYIVFIHKTERIFRILNYINNNEAGKNIILIHCKDTNDEMNATVWEDIQKIVPLLSKAGVFPHFNIKLEQITGEFGPQSINQITQTYNVTKNRIFVGTIHNHHKFSYEDLGGVRIIV